MGQLVSIVVATLRRTTSLRELLLSIKQQSYPEYEIILIDQNRTGFLAEILEEFRPQFPAFTHLEADHRGISAARNLGISRARGDIICFPDDDAAFLPDTIGTAQQLLATDSALSAVAGRTIDREGRDSVIRFCREASELDLGHLAGKFVEATMFVRREVFDRFMFDEALGVGTFHGAEEGFDLVWRMLSAGGRIRYSPEIRFYHPQKIQAHNTPAEIRRVFQYRCGFSRMCLKHRLYFRLLKQIVLITGYCGLLLFCGWPKLRYYLAELLGLLAGVVVP